MRPGSYLACVVAAVLDVSSGAARGEDWSEAVGRIRGLRASGDYAGARAVLDGPIEGGDAARAAERELIDLVLALPAIDRAALAAADSCARVVEDQLARGRFADAAFPARQRLDTYVRLLPRDHPDVARALADLSLVRMLTGDRAAEADVHDAVSRLAARLGEADAEVVTLYSNLGGALRSVGALDESERWLRRAVELETAAGPDADDRWSYAVNLLARVLDQRGDLARAEVLDREQLRRALRQFGPEHEQVARSLNNLGTTLHHMGELAEARTCFERALAMRRTLLDANHPDIATALNNLAASVEALGELAEAETLKRETLAIRRATYPEEHRMVAATKGSLALNLRRQRRLDEAEALFRESLAALEGALGPDHPEVGRAWFNLGSVLHDRARAAEADSACRRALQVFRACYGDSHRHVATTLRWLATLRVHEGDLAAAESLLVEASSVHERARRRIATAEHGEVFAPSPDADLAMVLAARGRGEDAFAAAERANARLLEAMLLSAPERGMSPGLQARRDSLGAALAAAEDRRFALRTAEAPSAAMEAADREVATLEAAWAESGSEIGPMRRGDPFPLPRVQRALDPGTALVGWLSYGLPGDAGWAWAWILRKDGAPHWIRLPWLPEAPYAGEPRTAAQRLREALRVAAAWPLRVGDDGPQRQDRAELWTARVAPLLPHLAGVTRLVVVPGDEMLGLPVECLLDGDGTTAGDRFEISYAPSATVFAWLAEQPASRARGMLAVGGTGSGGDAGPLPHAGAELSAVAAVYQGANVLDGSRATEVELTRLARADSLREYRVLHFATHAIADPDRPDRSALVLAPGPCGGGLAGAVAAGRLYDGRVTAGEIVREWHLDADLVTLSGCRTGLGRPIAGEGYLGLAHALFQAGARGVVMSLWDVDDRATALLMGFLHEEARPGRADSRLAGALAAAKRRLRAWVDPDGSRPFAHPVYWAGFILVGGPS